MLRNCWMATLMLIGLMVSASATSACDCAAPPEPKEALKASTAVFIGKVTSIARGNSPWRFVTFEVETSWKGVAEKQIAVLTALSSASCGFHFEEGKTYLVYANRVGGDGTDAKHLVTSICTRTKAVDDSTKEEIEALGQSVMPKP